jgi:hypothetical protein
MALPLKKTLGEIRSQIQSRLGFGMAGNAQIVNSALIDDFIIDAQEALYIQFDWVELKETYERNTGVNQQFYDYPPDCNVERIKSISVYWNGSYVPLIEGIDLEHRGITPGTIPCRYERRDQLEIWPIPQSSTYKLRFEYERTLLPLVDSSDRLSLPDEMVKLYALANAKAHYRQPDADRYAAQLEVMLQRLKSQNRSRTVWTRSTRRLSPYDSVSSDQDV